MVPEDVIGGERGGSLLLGARHLPPRRRIKTPLSSHIQRPERTRWPRRTPSSNALNTLDRFVRSLSETVFGHCVPVIDTGTQQSPWFVSCRDICKTAIKESELGCPRLLFIWTLRICEIAFESLSETQRTAVSTANRLPVSDTSIAHHVPLGD